MEIQSRIDILKTAMYVAHVPVHRRCFVDWHLKSAHAERMCQFIPFIL